MIHITVDISRLLLSNSWALIGGCRFVPRSYRVKGSDQDKDISGPIGSLPRYSQAVSAVWAGPADTLTFLTFSFIRISFAYQLSIRAPGTSRALTQLVQVVQAVPN